MILHKRLLHLAAAWEVVRFVLVYSAIVLNAAPTHALTFGLFVLWGCAPQLSLAAVFFFAGNGSDTDIRRLAALAKTLSLIPALPLLFLLLVLNALQDPSAQGVSALPLVIAVDLIFLSFLLLSGRGRKADGAELPSLSVTQIGED